MDLPAMRLIGTLLPKVAVFLVTAAVGFVVATVVVSAAGSHGPQSSASQAPQYLLNGPDTPAGPGVPVAFDEQPQGSPTPLASLSPDDLSAAADALLGDAQPAAYTKPAGFPRVPPVTQFDGGPFQGANCTLASGAMLARLGYGIVTTGSTLRTLQDDQDGGTGLGDLATALWRGYGVTFPSGLIRTDTLKKLLAAGYGAVIQGDYSKVPVALRLQKDFTGGHAIYLDGYYPGNAKRGIPESYYVIDPIGRPKYGYHGDWWPAPVVDAFALSWGGGRVVAMWGYPAGGSPPDVVGSDVVPIPPDSGGNGPSSTPAPPTATPTTPPSGSPSASPGGTPAPPEIVPVDAGDLTVELPTASPPAGDAGLGGVILIPIIDVCLFDPPPSGCPTGIEAVFDVGSPPIIQVAPGPAVDVLFVDSDRPDVAIVGFTVDPPAVADVKFWKSGASPATVQTASSMTSINLFGKTVLLARLDTQAGTTYQFQAVAGSGLSAGSSPIGSFTTGDGVSQFDVALSQVASPAIKLGTGLSPYLHLAPGGYAQPLIPLGSLGNATCLESAGFGGTQYCLDLGDAPPPATCTRAEVSYELTGIDATGVLVRAFPAESGEGSGGVTLDGVLEADGPAPAGTVSIGCLTPGMSYDIVLDAVGDDRGVLASRSVTVP